MTPYALDPKEIAQAIVEEMKAHGHALWLDPESHAEQHNFVAQLIEERKERLERRKRLEEKIAGSLVLSALLIVITVLGVGTMEWLRKNL